MDALPGELEKWPARASGLASVLAFRFDPASAVILDSLLFPTSVPVVYNFFAALWFGSFLAKAFREEGETWLCQFGEGLFRVDCD